MSVASRGHPGKDEIHIEPVKASGPLPGDKGPSGGAAPAASAAAVQQATTSAQPSASALSSTSPLAGAAPSASVEAADAAKKSDRQPAPPAAASGENGTPAPTPEAPATAPQAQSPTKTVQLVHPFSDRAGVLTIGGRSIQLSGVIPMDTSRTCTDANGKNWPCGVLARTALRMFLRGRTVDCDMPEGGNQDGVIASCRYAKTDLSDWLVRNGWAEPAEGSALADANNEARAQKRGIYGSDPRKGGKSTLAPPPPPENPLNPI